MARTVGQPVRRVEDARLLTGDGEFTDDLDVAGQAYAAMVRSPHAHARVAGIDAAAALTMPGVVAVLSGVDYAADGMQRALLLCDWQDFATRRAAACARGRLAGIGLANYVETSNGWPLERAEMTVHGDGQVQVIIGTQASGQGHETSFAQMVASLLGVPFDSVRLRTGDTDFVVKGSGSHSARSMRVGGHLFEQTADQVIERGRKVAARMLECAAEDVTFEWPQAGDEECGRFRVAGTDRTRTLFQVAAFACTPNSGLEAALAGPLSGLAGIEVPMPAYPNGCHVAEEEVDPETGLITLTRYTAVDDAGRIINPLLLEGQVHGGIVQGTGQATHELCVYDAEGQLLTGSFMDYAVPRADEVPFFTVGHNEVPTKTNLVLRIE